MALKHSKERFRPRSTVRINVSTNLRDEAGPSWRVFVVPLMRAPNHSFGRVADRDGSHPTDLRTLDIKGTGASKQSPLGERRVKAAIRILSEGFLERR
jgi:hypothetical protein